MGATLVLGGGGVWGIAWMVGVAAGLADEGVDLSRTDMAIGTSAGSVVGAQIYSGLSFASLFENQTDPEKQAHERPISPAVMEAAERATDVLDGITSPIEKLRRLGQYAMAATTTSEADHRNLVVSSRLPSSNWPDRRLLVTAVEIESGESCYFEANSGVDLVDAVAASCAVPKIWPPVSIRGRHYMDGGVRSLTNSHLAHGSSTVIVISPYSMDAEPFLGPTLRHEVTALQRQGTRVVVIEADETSIAIAGSSTLNIASREPAAQAGRRQGRVEAKRVASLV